jgi:hypothetical protein
LEAVTAVPCTPHVASLSGESFYYKIMTRILTDTDAVPELLHHHQNSPTALLIVQRLLVPKWSCLC